MTVSILDLHCLNAVCDDHETVESITAEVRRSSHGNVHDEAGECLAEIAAAGLVVIRRAKTGHASAPKTGHQVGGIERKNRLV